MSSDFENTSPKKPKITVLEKGQTTLDRFFVRKKPATTSSVGERKCNLSGNESSLIDEVKIKPCRQDSVYFCLDSSDELVIEDSQKAYVPFGSESYTRLIFDEAVNHEESEVELSDTQHREYLNGHSSWTNNNELSQSPLVDLDSPSYSPIASPNDQANMIISQPIPLDPNTKMMFDCGIRYIRHISLMPESESQLMRLKRYESEEDMTATVILGTNSQSIDSNYEEYLDEMMSLVEIDQAEESSQVQVNHVTENDNLEGVNDVEEIVQVESKLISGEISTQEDQVSISSITITKIDRQRDSDVILIDAKESLKQQASNQAQKTKTICADIDELVFSSFTTTKKNLTSTAQSNDSIKSQDTSASMNLSTPQSLEAETGTKHERRSSDVDETNTTKRLPFLYESVSSEILIQTGEMLIKYLKAYYVSQTELAKRYQFEELTLDLCTFLLSEHLKQKKDQKTGEDLQLKGLLMMNFCFLASDLLFNGSWQLFYDLYLKLESKYSFLVKNDLCEMLLEIERIINTATNQAIDVMNVNFKQFNFRIPKIGVLCKYLKDLEASGFNKTDKIVIVLNKNAPTLYKNLKQEIEEDTNLRVHILITSQSSNLEESLANLGRVMPYKYNCLLISNNVKFYDYLRYFKTCIAYESASSSSSSSADVFKSLKLACLQSRCEYVEFDAFKMENVLAMTLIDHTLMNPTQLIVSPSILKYNRLVEELECKMNMNLIVRDYERIQAKLNFKARETMPQIICNVDILFNEQVGLVLDELDSFNENDLFEKVKRYQHSLRTLYYVIFDEKKQLLTKNEYGEFNKRLSKIHNHWFLKERSSSESKFSFKLILLTNYESLLELVANVIESSHRWRVNTTSTLAYPSLSEKITSDEFLLICSGYFNSFSAQYILSRCGLDQMSDLYDRNQFTSRLRLILPSQAQNFFTL